MPLMRSNTRSRARSRLATSKPVNVMFSNGLGVCKYGNAGSKSICRKKTRVSTAPGAFITAVVNQFDYQGSNTAKIKLKYKTNIQGAKILLKGKIGGSAVTDLILLTPPVTNDDLYNYQEQKFESLLVGLTDGVVVSDIELTLTGGKISPSGGWNINNVETKIGVPNFTIDLAAPTLVSAEVFSTAKNKIIVTFSEPIKANPTLPVGAFTLANLPTGVTLNAATVVNGKVELTLSAGVVADPNTAENIVLDYNQATAGASALMDVAGNKVGTFTAEQVAIFGEFQISGITVVSDNSNPAIAIAGDKLTFTVVLNKPVTVASAGALVPSDVKLPFKIDNSLAIDSVIDLPVAAGSTLTFSHTLTGTESPTDGSIKSIVSTLPLSGGQYPPFKLSGGTTVKDSDVNELTGGTPAISGTDVVFYTAPIFSSAQVGENGNANELFITASKPIVTIGAQTTTDFTIAGVASPTTVTAIALDNGKVKLTLSANVVNTDTPTVAFTQSGSGTILEDAQGNQLKDFATAPVIFVISFVSAEVGTNGTDNEVFITFSEVIASISNPVTTDFTIGGVASTPTVTNITGAAGPIKLTLSANVVSTDNPTVEFVATTTVLEDAQGNDVGNLSPPKTIANNT